MAHQWRGVIREYFDRLDVDSSTPIITLGEGGTPLIESPALAKLVGADQVYLKYEGMNPRQFQRLSVTALRLLFAHRLETPLPRQPRMRQPLAFLLLCWFLRERSHLES
jgi:hypothetical protein